MRACFLAFCALVLVTHVAPPVLAQRSTEPPGSRLSGDHWAECFAVFTGMAAVLLAQRGPLAAQNAQDGAQDNTQDNTQDGARDHAAASGQGPADRFLALSEQAALRWLDSQEAGQDGGRASGGDRADLMTGLEQAVDQAIRTAALRSDFVAYLRRTSDRCIAAMNS